VNAPIVADRVMRARRTSVCPACSEPIRVGQSIARAGYWMHTECLIERNHGTDETDHAGDR
jgi:hypothetical protein